MAGFTVNWIAHYEAEPRRHGATTMKTKTFSTKWEAEKFIHEYKQNHWYCYAAWVEQDVIDNRSPMDRALAAQAHEAVARHMNKKGGRWL